MKKYFLQPFGVKVGVGFILLVVCHESIAYVFFTAIDEVFENVTMYA